MVRFFWCGKKILEEEIRFNDLTPFRLLDEMAGELKERDEFFGVRDLKKVERQGIVEEEGC